MLGTTIQEEHPMKRSTIGRWALRASAIAVIATLCTLRADTQDPNAKATFGSVELKAGFQNDPYVKELVAGGPIQTKLGGVTAWVSKEPDFRLVYTAGNFPLTIYAESKSDTTLLINLPDGTWIADDDSGGFPNPLIKIAKPKSGRYEIWVGSFKENELPKAVLKITELK
jgi:hypothetical protein